MLLVLAVVRLQRLAAARSKAGPGADSECGPSSSVGRGIVRRGLLAKLLARSPRGTASPRATAQSPRGNARPACDVSGPGGAGGYASPAPRALFASPAYPRGTPARHSYDSATPCEGGPGGGAASGIDPVTPASAVTPALRKLSSIHTAFASSIPSPRLSRSMTWHGAGGRPRASTLPDGLTAEGAPNGSLTPRGTSRRERGDRSAAYGDAASVVRSGVGALIKRSSSWSRRPRRPKGAKAGQRTSSEAISEAEEPPQAMVDASPAPTPTPQPPDAAASGALHLALPGPSLASLRPRSGTFGELPIERQ